MREAYGLMVNYRYDPKEIERNHEAYANEGVVASSRTVRGLLKTKVEGARHCRRGPQPPALPAPEPEKAGNLTGRRAAGRPLSLIGLPRHNGLRADADGRRAPRLSSVGNVGEGHALR